jgi:hypothetical protein
MQLTRPKPIELLKAHDQGPPFIGIDMVRLARREQHFLHVHALDTHLEDLDSAAQLLVGLGEIAHDFDGRFQLNGAFKDASCAGNSTSKRPVVNNDVTNSRYPAGSRPNDGPRCSRRQNFENRARQSGLASTISTSNPARRAL